MTRASLPLLPLLLLAACSGTRTLSDPTILLRTSEGVELGATTEYGVVFLGRTAQAGELEIIAWFGDGPSVESSAIEPIGDGLFTAETEIRLPDVPLDFREPRPGEEVVIVGRTEGGRWERTVRVLSDPRVDGVLLEVPPELRDRPDQVGANVFRVIDEDEDRARLVGLVSGKLVLDTAEGRREYLTMVGPRQLWRLAAHRKDRSRQRRWVYREDVL